MRWHGYLVLGAYFATLAVMCPAPIRADEALARELQSIREELQALRREVAEQGRMVRTLYDFADSEIDFEKRAKEQQEEERLALTPAVDIEDANLTSLGCGNPRSPEIAVITGDGGIRIYDDAGRIAQSLKRRGDIITAISYSPDGKLLLAGTKTGSLLAWDFSTGRWAVVAERMARGRLVLAQVPPEPSPQGN